MSREQHAGYITSLTMSPWLSSAFGNRRMSPSQPIAILQGSTRVLTCIAWIACFCGLLLPISPPATAPMVLSTFGVSILSALAALFAYRACNNARQPVSRGFALAASGALLAVFLAVVGPWFR
jgi:hypothetical protein